MSGPCGLTLCKRKDFASQKSEFGDADSGHVYVDPNELSDQLKIKNEMIVKHIIILKRKRNTIIDQYTKFKDEHTDLHTDIERLSYKIQLMTSCNLPNCKKRDFGAQKSENEVEGSEYTFVDPNYLSDELKFRNESIVKHIILLKRKRNTIIDEYHKIKSDNTGLNTDIERLTYKIKLITKSLAQRLKARSLYDKTLKEIENKYTELVKHSGKLLHAVEKEITDLETAIKVKSVRASQDQSIYQTQQILEQFNFKCLELPTCTEKIHLDTNGICCYDQEYPEKLQSPIPSSASKSESENKKVTTASDEDQQVNDTLDEDEEEYEDEPTDYDRDQAEKDGDEKQVLIGETENTDMDDEGDDDISSNK